MPDWLRKMLMEQLTGTIDDALDRAYQEGMTEQFLKDKKEYDDLKKQVDRKKDWYAPKYSIGFEETIEPLGADQGYETDGPLDRNT